MGEWWWMCYRNNGLAVEQILDQIIVTPPVHQPVVCFSAPNVVKSTDTTVLQAGNNDIGTNSPLPMVEAVTAPDGAVGPYMTTHNDSQLLFFQQTENDKAMG